MFCYKCGKEISDQAQFCNFCGAQMTGAQPQAAPAAQPAQPAQPVHQTDAPQPEKKGSTFKTLCIMVVCALVMFSISYTFTKKRVSQPTSSSSVIVLNNQNLMDGCINGALYKNDYLTYGLARLHMPGYSLLPGEDGGDWLISSDDSSLLGVNKQLEMGISYDASDADGILQSYLNGGIPNASMVDFRKYTVDGFPVIRYIVKGTADGLDEYIGELIVFPDKQPKETMRLNMVNLAEIGYERINQVFDTLDISSEYVLTQSDTQNVGYNRITAK